MVDIIALVLIFMLVYSYTFYPLLLKLLYFFSWKPYWHDYTYKPKITILISAYNEEDYIEDCFKSILNNEYDLNNITVLVGSDGSIDGTNEILEKYKSIFPNYEFYLYNRLGKNGVLNELLNKVTTDYIFFLDADCRIAPNSIVEMIKYFADETIGGVLSAINIKQKDIQDNLGSSTERRYQNFESNLRFIEGNILTVANSLGAFYGLRRDLVGKIPNIKIADDLYYLIKVTLSGSRVLFVKDIKTTEERNRTENDEFKRRERTISGGIGSLLQFSIREYLENPLFTFFLFSHKIIRYFMPFFLCFLIAMIPIMEDTYFKYSIIASSLTILLLGLLARLLRRYRINLFVLSIPYFMFGLLYSFFVGIFSFVTGSYSSKWTHIENKTKLDS